MTEQHSVDAEDGATKNGQQDVEAVTGDSAHFVFDDWCAEVGLNKKSVTLLKKECVSTVHVLSLLTGEDIVSLGSPLGQRKLMQEAIDTSFKSDRKDVVQPPLTSPPPEDVQVVHTVADLHTAPLATRGGEPPARGNPNEGGGVQASVTTRADEAGGGVHSQHIDIQAIRRQAANLKTSGKTFAALFQNDPLQRSDTCSTGVISQQSVSPLADHNLSSVFDPRTVLTMKAARVKTVQITQFLPPSSKYKINQASRRELVLSTGESSDHDGKLLITQHDPHPYSGISLSEWGAANCRLMNCLLVTGALKRANMEYYLAYITTIFSFVEKFEWHSILDFDLQYRELQAEHNFQWGTLMQSLELSLLMPRQRQQQLSVNKHRITTKQQNYPSNDTSEVCRRFLLGSCPFGRTCKYRHSRPPPPPSSGNPFTTGDRRWDKPQPLSQTASKN